MNGSEVLIVGAGPTGLAAALFLHERGHTARILDKAPTPDPHSRALAINPRTLRLLAPTGLTAAMLAEGRPIRHARLTQDWDDVLVAADTTSVDPDYTIVALSQARSEALLTQALAERGIRPERGVALTGLAVEDGRVVARLDGLAGPETASPRLLFAADGAHSPVRHALGLDFPGSAYPESWPLYDIHLDTDLALDAAHITLFNDGMLFALALEPGLWRVLGNVPDVLDRLPAGTRTGAIRWQSAFRISHRVASAAAVGPVALGGDAAHIHSPVGARGMNLGVEDAWVWAACAADALAGLDGRIADYGRVRHAVHRSVVRRVKTVTDLARGRSAALRLLRSVALPVVGHVPPLTRLMLRTVGGLDHAVRTH